MEEILKEIEKTADAKMLEQISNALVKGFVRVHPEWELVILSVPRHNKKERKKVCMRVVQQVLRERFDPNTGEPLWMEDR